MDSSGQILMLEHSEDRWIDPLRDMDMVLVRCEDLVQYQLELRHLR